MVPFANLRLPDSLPLLLQCRQCPALKRRRLPSLLLPPPYVVQRLPKEVENRLSACSNKDKGKNECIVLEGSCYMKPATMCPHPHLAAAWLPAACQTILMRCPRPHRRQSPAEWEANRRSENWPGRECSSVCACHQQCVRGSLPPVRYRGQDQQPVLQSRRLRWLPALVTVPPPQRRRLPRPPPGRLRAAACAATPAPAPPWSARSAGGWSHTWAPRPASSSQRTGPRPLDLQVPRHELGLQAAVY